MTARGGGGFRNHQEGECVPTIKKARVERERVRILAALDANGLTADARVDPYVYGYHDPFITPNWLRRNEVCVQVQETAALRATA